MSGKKTINISAIITNEGNYPENSIHYVTKQETKNDDMFINALGEIFCGTTKIGTIIEHGFFSRISEKVKCKFKGGKK